MVRLENLQMPKMREPFYDNGNPRFTGKFKDGQMHGAWKFFRKDGSLMRTGEFKLGEQVGIWKTYDRSGNSVKETNFGS